MNTTVTATGMKVKATAEKGIVISNSLRSSWADSANAQVLSATLYPTSHNVAEGTAGWVHNTSNDAEHALPNQTTYEALTIALSGSTEGIGYVDMDTSGDYNSTTEPAYYLVNQFYIKSSDAEITSTHLYINDVTATSATSYLDVDVSLRVLIDIYEYSGSAYALKSSNIYAPVATSKYPTTDYNWKGLATGAEAVLAKFGADGSTTHYNTDTNVTTIPATSTSNPIKAMIYVYFEGEDGNCRTKNIAGLTPDDITVSVKFGTAKLGTDFTQANYVALVQKMDNITSTVDSGSIAKDTAFTATYALTTEAAAAGYTLPTDITVKINGVELAPANYTYSAGVLSIAAAQVTGTVEVTVAAVHS